MALISALLLLLVITILGVGMFRGMGLQQKIAGNTRERQRAVHAAESAQAYAEWWLSANAGNDATTGVVCTGLVSADTATPQICSNRLSTAVSSVATVPWKISGTEVGNSYTPPGLQVGSAGANYYYLAPRFYISYLGGNYDAVTGAQTNSYQVNATGYGGTQNAVTVVESSYVVSKLYTTQNSKSKFIKLDAP